MQPPQEPQTGQPIYPGYGTPTGTAPYTAYGAPAPSYGYQPYGYGQAPPAPQTSSFAIASLVCSIASWFVIPFVGAIAAVVLGHIARSEIRRSYGLKSGGGMAIAGLVIGYIQIVASLLVLAAFLLLVLAFASDSSSY